MGLRSDKEILKWFIETNFSLDWGRASWGDTGLVVKDRKGENLKLHQLTEMMDKIFTNFKLSGDNFHTVKSFTIEWYDEEKKKIFEGGFNFLSMNYELALGERNWCVVDKLTGKMVNKRTIFDNIQKHLKGKYTEGLLELVYYDWHEMEVIHESEKMMGMI